MQCHDNGQSPLTWNIKEGETYWSWPLLAESYAELDSFAKNTFYRATAKDHDGTSIEYAAKRHDVLVEHYKYTGFMANSSSVLRSSGSVAMPLGFVSENNNSSVFAIVGATTLITLLTVGGFFFIRRKRA